MANPPKRSYFVGKETFESIHQSFRQRIEGEHNFRVYRSGSRDRLKAYNGITKELQEIIGRSVKARKSLRARGSGWSLSTVAAAKDQLINTKALRIAFTLPKSLISPNYGSDHSKLRFIECGNSIDAINRLLFQDRLSLKASGSNNGQTLAGALSTGTHGSAFQFGAISEFVVGLHLIVGTKRQVYLQRATYPVVKRGFANKLGAEFIQDDSLFNAALVSFGSFGIIHGIMIEARELFLLHSHRFYHKFNRGLRYAISSLNFTDLGLPSSVPPLATTKPYHFEVIFNPNEGTPPKEGIVTFMLENPWSEPYVPPEWDDGAAGPGSSALDVMGALIDLIPKPIDQLLKPIFNGQVRDYFEPVEQKAIIRDLFRGEKTIGKTLSAGMGVPLSHALEGLNVVLQTYKNFETVLPVLIVVRFVKGTQALLGFTKFSTTCILEIDGINNRKTQQLLRLVWRDLANAGIPFTLHWGKFNSYLTASRVRQMYGDAVPQWISSRETLLDSPEVRDVFTNQFVQRIGLAS